MKWAVPVIFGILVLALFPLNDAFAAVFIDSIDVSGQDTTPTAVTFSTDGLTMFVLGDAGDDVNEYACGAAFDVSTCVFTVKAGNPFSVAAQETDVRSIVFTADGLKMFVTGFDGDEVNEYACGTGFDVSTCSFTVKTGNPFSVAAQETIPQALAFSTDGLTMFVLGTGGIDVNEYACGAAFDVSTCAFTVKAGNPFSVFAQAPNPTGLAFSTDGLTMFVIGEGEALQNVNEYALGIPFDVSSVPIPVGGTSIPIDQSALLLAGVQSVSMWMIPVILAGVVIGVFVIKRRN